MGPWQIKKELPKAVWNCFAAILFALTWLRVKSQRSCHAFLDRRNENVNCYAEHYQISTTDGDSVGSSVCLLVYHFILLVSLFFNDLPSFSEKVFNFGLSVRVRDPDRFFRMLPLAFSAFNLFDQYFRSWEATSKLVVESMAKLQSIP